MSIWELGSDFHLSEDLVNGESLPYLDSSVCFGSGRHAIAALVDFGVKHYKWDQIALPAYYCESVVNSIQSTEIHISRYTSAPNPDADVCLVNNLFGLTHKPEWLGKSRAVVIEDHTHDLLSDWLLNSDAHYCFASVRKSLPVPDGALLWSPKALELPEPYPVTRLHQETAHQKLAAMVMKWQYLKGRLVLKSEFRRLFIEAENNIGHSGISGMMRDTQSLLANLPAKTMRQQRMRNFWAFEAAFGVHGSIRLMRPAQDAVPFMIILLFDNIKDRDALKTYLIGNQIYPAVLWGEAKMLAVACDYRYTSSDMEHVAEIITSYEF